MEKHHIIIVGGGMSGIGCARRLQENGHSFKMITEDIGGRVKTSPDGKVNYGAVYLTKDYKNTLPFAELGRPMKMHEICFWNGNKHYGFFSFRFLKHIPAFLRLRKDVREYQKLFWKQGEMSIDRDRAEIIESNPYSKKCYHQKADEYIHERGLDALVDEYLQPLLWGVSIYSDCREVSKSIFLGLMMALLSTPHFFIMHFDKMIENFKKDILFDAVVEVKRRGGLYHLTTKSGEHYECEKLVLATPMHITNTLVTPQKIKRGADLPYYHLTGEIKAPYDKPIYNLFPVAEKTMIWRDVDGSYLCTFASEDRIGTFFHTWKVITRGKWKSFLYLFGDEIVNVHPEPNLFLANDHNVFSMEAAYISGMYAAKMVMESQKKQLT